MYVFMLHTIKDPASFQTRGQRLAQDPPAGAVPLLFLPDTRGARAACLWQADSVDAVQEFVDGTLGDASDQEYFAVAEQHALGLPATERA